MFRQRFGGRACPPSRKLRRACRTAASLRSPAKAERIRSQRSCGRTLSYDPPMAAEGLRDASVEGTGTGGQWVRSGKGGGWEAHDDPSVHRSARRTACRSPSVSSCRTRALAKLLGKVRTQGRSVSSSQAVLAGRGGLQRALAGWSAFESLGLPISIPATEPLAGPGRDGVRCCLYRRSCRHLRSRVAGCRCAGQAWVAASAVSARREISWAVLAVSGHAADPLEERRQG